MGGPPSETNESYRRGQTSQLYWPKPNAAFNPDHPHSQTSRKSSDQILDLLISLISRGQLWALSFGIAMGFAHTRLSAYLYCMGPILDGMCTRLNTYRFTQEKARPTHVDTGPCRGALHLPTYSGIQTERLTTYLLITCLLRIQTVFGKNQPSGCPLLRGREEAREPQQEEQNQPPVVDVRMH